MKVASLSNQIVWDILEYCRLDPFEKVFVKALGQWAWHSIIWLGTFQALLQMSLVMEGCDGKVIGLQ